MMSVTEENNCDSSLNLNQITKTAFAGYKK